MKLQPILLALLASTWAPAFGQAFNIDCVSDRSRPLPSPTYGAAAGQTGTWTLGSFANLTTLTDITGAATDVTFACTGGSADGLNVPTSNVDEFNLLTDFVTMTFQGNFITIAGMQAGWYDLYVYCWTGVPEALNFEARVFTGDSVGFGLSADSGQPWPGGQVEGITYAKATFFSQGGLSIQTSPPLNDQYYVSGIQLVPVPAPGGLAAMALGGVFAFGRRRR